MEGPLLKSGAGRQEDHIDTQLEENDETEEERHDDDDVEKMSPTEKGAEETGTLSGNSAEKAGAVTVESASSKASPTETESNTFGNMDDKDSFNTVGKENTTILETRSEAITPAESAIGICSETLRDELTTADKAYPGNDEMKDEERTIFDKKDMTASETASGEIEASGEGKNVNGKNVKDLSPSDKQKISAGDADSKGLQVANKCTAKSDTANSTA